MDFNIHGRCVSSLKSWDTNFGALSQAHNSEESEWASAYQGDQLSSWAEFSPTVQPHLCGPEACDGGPVPIFIVYIVIFFKKSLSASYSD